jgi:NDP-sugar pyrophosphorylase family protein
MKAVILAGGLGTRLRPFTEVIPKPLLPFGEKSLMEIQIQMLKQHGFTDLHVATNYKSDYVEAFLGDGSKFGVSLRFSKESKPLGTCGPLALLRKELTEPFIVMNGDILTKLDLRAFYDFGVNADSTLTVGTKIISTPFAFGNVTADANNHIVDIEEKPDLMMEIIGGIYCMKPGVLAMIPDDEYFGMDTLIKKLLAARQPVSRYIIHEYWLDIGQIEDYSKAQDAYSKHFS